MHELAQLPDTEYHLISKLVYEKFGINLGEQKRSLIVGRLNKILVQKGFKNFKQYYEYVVNEPSGQALTTLVDRISTNHTFFYREHDHFEYFSEIALPEIVRKLKQQNRRDLRIWCCGCSTGEESYTLAMLCQEYFGRELGMWEIGQLATDISTRALEKAIQGIYPDENAARLPAHLKHTYLQRRPDGDWEVKHQLKEIILYRRLNLIQGSYPFKKKFAIIFCRNVMIYFDKPTREELVRRFSRYMEPGGYLFVGHSESLGRGMHDFRYIKPAIYRKSESA